MTATALHNVKLGACTQDPDTVDDDTRRRGQGVVPGLPA